MRLAWLHADLAGARRAALLLAGLLAASMLANLALAVLATQLAQRERVVLVPPTISKTFWLDEARVSPEYLEQMGWFLAQLVLNVTPQSVDQQARVLLQYAAPQNHGLLRAQLAAAAQRLRRDGASTLFSVQEIAVDEQGQRVGLRGQLATFIGERRVSEHARGYAIDLQYAAGRIHIKAFRETNPNDPLELQAAAGGDAQPAR